MRRRGGTLVIRVEIPDTDYTCVREGLCVCTARRLNSILKGFRSLENYRSTSSKKWMTSQHIKPSDWLSNSLFRRLWRT